MKWGLNWVHYVHGAERGEISKRKSSVKVLESLKDGHSCVIRRMLLILMLCILYKYVLFLLFSEGLC